MDKIFDQEKLFCSLVKFDQPKDGSNEAMELLAAFRCYHDRTLIVDAESRREWTGAQLLDRAGRIATGLIRQAGLKPRDLVLMHCDHDDHSMILLLAITLAGGSIVFSDPKDCLEEERGLCRIVKPKFIATHTRLHHLAEQIQDEFIGSDSRSIIWMDRPTSESITTLGDSDRAVVYQDLFEGPFDEELIEHVSNELIAPDQDFVYLLTSGTTSRPKLVPTTHQQFLHRNNVFLSGSENPICSADAPQSMGAKDFLNPIGRNSVIAGNIPPLHGISLTMMCYSIMIGCRYVVMPEYQAEKFWQAVNDFRLTATVVSTSAAHQLLSNLKILTLKGDTNNWDLSCFKCILATGSKPAYFELADEIKTLYDNILTTQLYGATEVGFISQLSVKEAFIHRDSVGYLSPSIVAKIVCEETGKLLGPNERGQLHVWSKGNFTSYRCSPGDDSEELTAQCHDDQGFYKTGDIAHFDQDQRLYLHGRIKDTLYLLTDLKVTPSELESVVNRHPLVDSSAVIGLPDPEVPNVQKPRAFVKLISKDSKKFEELVSDELRRSYLARDERFIANHICEFYNSLTADCKHLRGGVRIVEDFPLVGQLNKIDRNALRSIV